MAYGIFRASRSAIQAVSRRTRARRMRALQRRLPLRAGLRVLDMGGTPAVWSDVPQRLDITIVNLPGETGAEMPSHHSLHFIEADACDLSRFADRTFDLVFSNSVIEHVGDERRQEAFAREARRLGKAYWVQTPARWFPIEAHTGMPLWWWYPERVRHLFLRRWRRRLPAWADSMAQTRVLSLGRLRALFPEGQVYVERLAGIPKSYASFSPQETT